MDKTLKYLVVVLGVLAIVFGTLYYATPKQKPPLGSITGPDFYFPYVNYNGFRTYYYHVPANTSSTTICSIQTPNATTTLDTAKFSFTDSTTTAHILEWGTDPVNNTATTTSLGRVSLGSVVKGTFFASSTSILNTATQLGQGELDSVAVLAPNSFLNLNDGGGGGCTVGGTCNVYTTSSCNIKLIGS